MQGTNPTSWRDRASQDQTVPLIAEATTLRPDQQVVHVDGTKTFVLTLPNITESAGRIFYIRCVGGTGAVTIDSGGDDLTAASEDLLGDAMTADGDYAIIENICGRVWYVHAEVTT